MKNKIKVIYSIATKIGSSGLGTVSCNAVKALDEFNLLKKAISYGNKCPIDKSKIVSLPGNPAKLIFFLPKHYYRPLRKGFLDFITSKIINTKGCDVFHGWNNQALRSIKSAKKIGAKTILECGSTHRFFRDRIINEEYEKYKISRQKSPDYAIKASLEEIALADYIFVPSEFAKKTFIDAGVDENKIFIIKRGVDIERFKPKKSDHKKFRVLFVGKVSLRKGIQYLLEAWKELNLKNAELIVVGNIEDSIKPLLAKFSDLDNLIFKGYLKNIIEEYQQATIFVFPSLEEGSAKVTYEAMASGLPVITTENSGSVIRDGIDGFIIPAKDKEAIKEKIVYFYENKEEIEKMGKNARENIKAYTWDKYKTNFINIYRRIFSL
ncbi:glycosyltransferase family 4 protein [Thermodesulfovibrio sp.]|jgi:glycosyltransferase involved in cell wall biosynthesis|uniref:glycosyltransferase family 4 protein n=1 Tax=Thermodesulfovibrio TaxID=28261 RepID=UPI002614664F|nr:glycosyltransferase family 4 protein [Thermodesulfovibrio sp.]